MNREPEITVNGHTLAPGEAMTVRVALQSFAESLAQRDALGDDEHGRRMRDAYLAAVGRINRYMAEISR